MVIKTCLLQSQYNDRQMQKEKDQYQRLKCKKKWNIKKRQEKGR